MRQIAPWLLAALLFVPNVASAGDGEQVRFERPDGAVLEGTLHLLEREGRHPMVLLLHQAQSSRQEFDFLLEDLHGLGLQTLGVDLRGHGTSSKPETIDRAFFIKLFRDPSYAPPDIQAILDWLAAHDRVDPERIAVMGGSVGANLAYVANGAGWHVKTSVSLSGNAEAAADLAGNVEDFTPRNVLLIATDNDHGRDAYAQTMYDGAGEPRRVEILEGSSAHGASVLQESEELKQVVLTWLVEQLGS